MKNSTQTFSKRFEKYIQRFSKWIWEVLSLMGKEKNGTIQYKYLNVCTHFHLIS